MSMRAGGDNEEEVLQYSPLPSTEHIRILVLQPLKSFGDPIFAEFEIARVTKASKYAALSYSWGMNEDGDDSKCRTITVQGASLAITQNLFEGLQRLLSSEEPEPLRLWVDAVCINQADTREQSTQVAMMAEIYSNADRTIIWLGEGREEDDLQAFQLFQRIQDIKTNVNKPNFNPVLHSFVASGVGRCTRSENSFKCSCGQPCLRTPYGRAWDGVHWDERELSMHRTLLERFVSNYMALACFASRRYWTRRWIVQELRYPGVMSIHWNRFNIPALMLRAIYDQFADVCMVCEKLMQSYKMDNFDKWSRQNARYLTATPDIVTTGLLRKQLHHIQFLISKDWGIHGRPEWDLERLMYLFNDMECSDPRDRLFSLLNPARIRWIEADYGQSTVQVYTAFARGLIERGRADIVFENVNRLSPTDDISANLPSWVPDLRERYRDHRYGGQRYDFVPNNRRRERTQLSTSFDASGNLVATFFLLGTVTNFSNPASPARYFELVSTAQAKPWLGVLDRKTTKTISHYVTYREDCTFQPLISRLRDGDILCTSHGHFPPSYNASVDGERVMLFLRRTDSNKAIYSIVYRLGLYELDITHWDLTAERTVPNKITVQLV